MKALTGGNRIKVFLFVLLVKLLLLMRLLVEEIVVRAFLKIFFSCSFEPQLIVSKCFPASSIRALRDPLTLSPAFLLKASSVHWGIQLEEASTSLMCFLMSPLSAQLYR